MGEGTGTGGEDGVHFLRTVKPVTFIIGQAAHFDAILDAIT